MKTNFQKNKEVEHPKESLPPKSGDKKSRRFAPREENMLAH